MDRRHEILIAATKSFTLFGYKATTIEQVAKIANVGKGTIYTFFKNKEELFQEVVFHLIGEMKRETDQLIDVSASFMQNAHTALMKMLQFRERHLLFAKLIDEERALGTPEVQQMLLKIESEIISYVSMRIRNGIAKGEVIDCNPEHVAFLLFKSYLAFIVDWQLTHNEPLNEQEILTLFSETIFRGLAKKK
ncbi:TetR/AcrR family transcriptional regulator [Solibacillus sp. FSL K6-1781]|uniref:DNA-binding transcriptional repressor AcrR n=1 Tax=Solibacillus isronensis B3W22 TaxID=1224748 RepID=K1KL70_9BACL|nr:TetR/AcrR family transcriptional regulator [Solibacillus isronensis]AMO86850.1 TetR family transcriptional regulator [Solibacillus silvestris]EKB44905.1 DNA-binding transcriptional repressor AcrR [Solibacillus isronensis B3W22]